MALLKIDPTMTDAAIGFASLVLVGAWHEMNSLKKHMTKWTERIDTTLFGATGGNGMNGTIKDHEERLRYLERKHLASGLDEGA